MLRMRMMVKMMMVLTMMRMTMMMMLMVMMRMTMMTTLELTLTRILEQDLVASQSEFVSRSVLVLKGNLLLGEDKWQSGLAVFGAILAECPDSVESYLGVARCLERMGKVRNELDVWRIICHILHLKADLNTPEVETPDLSAKILRTLLRVSPRLSLGSGLLSLARRCHELGEYKDAADSYLDILALDPPDLPDKTGVKLEAVLALLLDRDHEPEVVERRREASLRLLEDVVTRSRAESVKRKGEDQSRMIVTYFLFGKTEDGELTD